MKQSKTTLKELTAAYRAVLHHGILCNAIALGLIVLPVTSQATVVEAPITNKPVFVIGDVALNNQHVANGEAAFAGRRLDNVVDGKYQNVFPNYQLVARSFDMKNSDAYVGPVTLTLRELNENDAFAFNYQDSIAGKWKDINLASLYPDDLIWNASFADIKAAGFDDQHAGTISVFAHLDGDAEGAHDAGTLSFDNTHAVVDGATINALDGTISITNGSALEFVKQDTDLLNTSTRFFTNTADIDSNGVTNLNAKNINIDGSTLSVGTGAKAVFNASEMANLTNVTVENAQSGITNSGNMTISASTLSDNTATPSGGAIYNEGVLTVNDGTVFSNNNVISTNRNNGHGGAIYNAVNAEISLDDVVFENNTSGRYAGAIGNAGTLNINDVSFTGNTVNLTASNGSGALGGAIYNESTGEITLTGNNVFENNSAYATENTAKGGAIYNSGSIGVLADNFTGNSAVSDTDKSYGGAIFNGGSIEALTSDFTNNFVIAKSAANGGAVHNAYGSANIIGNIYSNFTNNSVTSSNGIIKGGALYSEAKINNISGNFSENSLTANNTLAAGGAFYNDNGYTVTNVLNSTFSDNTVTSATQAQGGAIFVNKALNLNNVVFDDNSVTATGATGIAQGGALYNNNGNTILTDTSFVNNMATGTTAQGGAIFTNADLTINAKDKDVTFSGNTANGADNDIYVNAGYASYYGTWTSRNLNLNAADGRTMTLSGGIDGNHDNNLIINAAEGSTGTINIAGNLNNLTTVVSNGTLHLSNGMADGSNLLGSSVTVANGATINTIDNTINDYITGDKIVLQDGAIIKGDISLADDGSADTYAADNNANVTYKLANALNLPDIQSVGEKTIRVTNDGATVNADKDFRWYNSTNGLSLNSAGDGTGSVLVKGFTGGINNAVDITDESAQEIEYALTAESEEFNGEDNLIQNAVFAITGNGNSEETDNKLVLANDLVVNDDSTLSLTDIIVAQKTGSEEITNQENATLNIKDSLIKVAITNHGTLISDPTTYTETVTNTGTASFDGDSFNGASAVLANSGTVNLSGGTGFYNMALITGSGTTNLLGGTTHFNNTANTNNINLKNGADFDGTLIGGVLNTQNSHIDNVSGAFSNGNLYVDADLTGNGAIDSFVNSETSTIKNINLISSEYGNNSYYSLNVGGASLAEDVTFSGDTNYYTKVSQNGDNILFSDKLMNTSGMHNQLGSWEDGNYIAGSNSYDNTTDSYTETAASGTVGAALTALDNQVKANADNIALKANAADLAAVATSGNASDLSQDATHRLVTDDQIASWNNKQDAITVDNKLSASLIDGLVTTTGGLMNDAGFIDGSYDNTNSGLTATTIQDAIDETSIGVTQNTQQLLTLNGDASVEGSVANTVKLSAENADYNSSVSHLSATTIKEAIDENAAAIATLNGGVNDAGSVAFMLNQGIAQNNALTLGQAKAYTDERVDKLDKQLSDGVASAVALSAVAVSNVRRGEVSVGGGYGNYNGQSAMAFGAAMGLSSRWSVNAGTGISESNVSFRAGTNYKFKLF